MDRLKFKIESSSGYRGPWL